MPTTTSHLFAALFALLLTATMFQQAVAVPPASAATPVASYELA